MQKWEYLRVEVVADRAKFQLTNTINGQLTRYPYPQSLMQTSDTHDRIGMVLPSLERIWRRGMGVSRIAQNNR
jgi:hypothetical protein